MDLVYGLAGGLVLAWVGKKFIKQMWLVVILAFLIPVILIGSLLGSGISIPGIIATIIGIVIGIMLPPKRKEAAKEAE